MSESDGKILDRKAVSNGKITDLSHLNNQLNVHWRVLGPISDEKISKLDRRTASDGTAPNLNHRDNQLNMH